jgi:hypothetical protein
METTVNQNIMARMKELGLRRKTVADQLHIDASYFYKMLTGERRWQLEYLTGVAEVLKLPLWRLFYDQGDGAPETACPDLLLGPADREFLAAKSEEYVKLPVAKLSVSLVGPEEPTANHAAWVVMVKKKLLEGIAMGKKPAAVELGLKVC